MYGSLTLQPKGEKGALRTDGYVNFWYVRDKHGKVWWVSTRWDGGGWGVGAGRLPGGGAWCAGDRFVSR